MSLLINNQSAEKLRHITHTSGIENGERNKINLTALIKQAG
jgi:hypothetical protein